MLQIIHVYDDIALLIVMNACFQCRFRKMCENKTVFSQMVTCLLIIFCILLYNLQYANKLSVRYEIAQYDTVLLFLLGVACGCVLFAYYSLDKLSFLRLYFTAYLYSPRGINVIL